MAQQPLPVGRHEPADARRRLNVIPPRPKRNPARASRPAEHTREPGTVTRLGMAWAATSAGLLVLVLLILLIV
ncbi:hypothetical protein ARZXY2_4400 (plasmid) [Arthrobacter sp. ZXY-2]|nr:hypothetical protein ARZXY2_4400 [Arthrobacter sp. ZXY-2]